MEFEKNKSYEEALKSFLLKKEDWMLLEDTQAFNLFDVLKIARTEIRHSNVLAWLFNPAESHGFGNKILSSLNEYLVQNNLVNNDNVAFKLLTLKFDDIIVYREWQNIDVLIESENEKYIVCIENKIDSQDHSNQLDKYFSVVNNKYDDTYTKIFLYLTPEGMPPREDSNDVWKCIRYKAIIDIVEKQMKKCDLKQEIKAFVDNYIAILRRETMENINIVELCQKIYKEHKVALDLIFEYRPDRLQNVAEHFVNWCKKQHKDNKIIFAEKNSSKSYCRFRTSEMDNLILPTKSISGWGTTNHYFYELSSYMDKEGNVKFCIQLSFSSQNLEEKNVKQLEFIDQCSSKRNRVLKENWQWRTVFKSKTETIKADVDLPELQSNNENSFIDNKLDKLLKEVLIEESKIIEVMKKIDVI